MNNVQGYKNVLADKYMRDTNYILIKDTNDLDELEKQWDKFNSYLTIRQQRLADDKSIELWNMTNQQHYLLQKEKLLPKEDPAENIIQDKEDQFPTDTIGNIDDSMGDMFKSFEPLEESDDIKDKDISDSSKESISNQYTIDTNINIVGKDYTSIHNGLDELEKDFTAWNSQSHDLRKKSDDKCREIYGMSNIERYNKIKGELLRYDTPSNKVSKVSPEDETNSNDSLKITNVEESIKSIGGFVLEQYNSRKALNEKEESIIKNKHRRFNDTPYFTPQELIDLGVHGNDNFYSKTPDNDGLITKVKIPTWFDSYKDMCMDHIFEDYRKDWIDTLDMLYSDFDDIKKSGDEEKILSRKQSILDLGWNPEIPFNRKNRLKASERVSKILDDTIPKDVFISLNNIIDPGEDIMEEQADRRTHKPILLIFTQGKTPIISQGIKFVTKSSYSHASISFDPELNEVYSYNMRGENFGFIRENLSSFQDNMISVMAFFAPNNIVQTLKNKIKDFQENKTTFDLRIFFNKILHIDHKVSNNEYKQVCSTFVDTVLKSGGINLVGDIEIPDPGQLYNGAKTMPNKIIEVFQDIATKYDGKKVKRKLNLLYDQGTLAINESSVYYNDNNILEEDNNMLFENLSDIRNGVNPYSNKTFFHVSFEEDMDEKILTPRIPSWIKKKIDEYGDKFINELEKTKKETGVYDGTSYEEYKTPRVCFSNSIDGALNAIINNNERHALAGKVIYVYVPEKPISEYKHKMNKNIIKDKDVFDANITNEMWILEPVKVKFYGTIVIDKVIESRIKRKQVTNKNMTILKYNYKWHWFYKRNKKDLEKESINESTSTLPLGVTLRNATKDDTDNMFKWKMESIDKGIRNDPKVIKYIEKDVQDSIKITKMIMYNGKTIGMFTTDRLEPGSDYWYIGEIYIVKEYRNKGIGTALLKDEISKHDKIKLQVAQSNHGAMKLYKSLGFEITDRNDEGKLYIMTLDKKDFADRINEETITVNEVLGDIVNGVNPYSKKTFYHISFDDSLDGKVLKPRIPTWITNKLKENEDFIKELEKLKDSNSDDGYGFEEYKTPRVCLSNSIEGCLNARINEKGKLTLHNKTLYVYTPEKPISEYKHKTNKQILKDGDIFDANATNEMWILEPVKMKYVGSIVVDKITNEQVKKFANNKNKTNIQYKYKWHWFHKIKYRYDDEKNKFVKEQVSILNEVKRFPIEFDKEGNLIIYKARVGSLAFGDEIDDSVQLLQAYRNASNIEGIKYELAKLWYINDCIEKKLKKRLSNDQYKELIDTRATCLNVFKTNLDYVMKAEKGFNFSDYYNSTPFSDNSTKITANTLKYMVKTVTNVI